MRRTVACILTSLVLVVAACGDDDDDGAASTPAATAAETTAPAETSAAPTTATESTAAAPATSGGTEPAAEPAGEPLVVAMNSLDSGPRQQPAYADGLQAWVDRVNEEGGIDGHPVQFDRCDTQSDLDRQAECARGHADNPEVLIVSGLGTETGTVALPIYEPAGLGLISVSPFTPVEMSSENSVALSGSIRTGFPSLLGYFHDQGLNKVNMIALDIATVTEAVANYERIAGEMGMEWGGTTPIALDSPDMLPAVTAALEGDPEVLLLQVLPPQLIGILEALETLGSDIPVIGGSPFVTPDALALPAAQGRLFFESDVAEVAPDDPSIEDYEYLQERFGDALGNPQLLGFILGRAFQQAIEGAGGAEATRETVLEFIRTGEFVGLPWMPESISRTDAPPELPSVANDTTFVVQPDGDGGFEFVSDRIEPQFL